MPVNTLGPTFMVAQRLVADQAARRARSMVAQDLTGRKPRRAYDWTQHFAAGQQGFVLMPGRIETLFQDIAGTERVTSVGQPVARILDISGRGNHFSAQVIGEAPLFQRDGSLRERLQFDGTDFLSGPALSDSPNEQMCVVVGIAADTNNHRVILSGGSGSDYLHQDLVSNTYSYRGSGNASNQVDTPASYSGTRRLVVSGLSNVSAASPRLEIRVNGAFRASAAVSSNTFQSSELYRVGIPQGEGSRFLGSVYGIFLRHGPLPSQSELTAIETAMNEATGAY